MKGRGFGTVPKRLGPRRTPKPLNEHIPGSASKAFRPTPGEEDKNRQRNKDNIGALMVRIGFWGMLYYNDNTEPPK